MTSLPRSRRAAQCGRPSRASDQCGRGIALADDLHRSGDKVHEAGEGDEQRQRNEAARDEKQADHPCAEHDEIAAAVGPRIQNSADTAGAELFPVKVFVGLVMGTVDA